MHHDWILDVLRDLTAFSQANGMPGLAEHLEDAQLLAAAEMERADGAGEGRGERRLASNGADAAGSGGCL